MILRTNKLQEGTTVTENANGGLTLTKAVNIEPVLKANYEARKDPQNGFSKDRSIRRVMSVPFETWLEVTKRNPEILFGDKELREKTLRKWMLSEEAKPFRTVERGI